MIKLWQRQRNGGFVYSKWEVTALIFGITVFFIGAVMTAIGLKKNGEGPESLGRPWVIGGVACCFCAVTIPGCVSAYKTLTNFRKRIIHSNKTAASIKFRSHQHRYIR
ncbi:unnamed protein product [Spodoptera littoralis]|uniref:Uncharacterized protein n=1 Tax=Spodoptera littoralis TaxID=7109 RepID=A0A9P0N7S2_SPOLI|nr:unnamed protein product [Spodoptera littoralis]CAH1645559.1 unnamed protein product [Spodoptera littoralis]